MRNANPSPRGQKAFGKLLARIPHGMTNRLFVLICVIGILLVVSLGTVVAGITGNLLYKDTTTLLDTQARQAVNAFDQYVQILRNTAMTASRQTSIQSLVRGDYTQYGSYVVYRDAYAYLKNVHEFYSRVHLQIFVKRLRYVMSSNPTDVTGDYRKRGVEDADWFRQVEESPSGMNLVSNFVPPVSSAEEQFAFVLGMRNVYNWNTDGYLVASIEKQVLGDLLKGTSLEQNGFLLVLTPDGHIAYNSDPERFSLYFTLAGIREEVGDSDHFTGTRNKDFYYTSSKSLNTGWQFITFTDKRYAKTQVFTFQFLMLLVAGVTITLLVVVARLTSKAYTRPIERLIQFIHEAEKNEFAGQIELKSEDEVADLLHSFNAMITSVRQNQVLRKKAEIDALQKQIDPHFLFNTFESIKALSQQGDMEGVSTMIEKLSDMFRYNTNRDGSTLTTIREEVSHLRNYLDIQRVRFGSRLEVVWNIQPEVLACRTPRFILQPIAENSISHAMEKMKGGYRFEIIGTLAGPDVVFKLRDNGPGISGERLPALQAHVSGKTGGSADTRFGIGLRNIQERLALLYGEQYGLSIRSAFGEWTEIEVRIPVLRDTESTEET